MSTLFLSLKFWTVPRIFLRNVCEKYNAFVDIQTNYSICPKSKKTSNISFGARSGKIQFFKHYFLLILVNFLTNIQAATNPPKSDNKELVKVENMNVSMIIKLVSWERQSSNYCIKFLYAHTKAQVCAHKGTSKISFLQNFTKFVWNQFEKYVHPKAHRNFHIFKIWGEKAFWIYENFDVPLGAHHFFQIFWGNFENLNFWNVPLGAHTCASVCCHQNFNN